MRRSTGMSDQARKSSKDSTTVHLPNIKNPKRAAERLKLGFQRSEATVKNVRTGRELPAPMIMIDISETGVGLFSPKNLAIGTKLELNVSQPLPMVAKGIVAWCIPTPSMLDSTITRHPYRCGLKFLFSSDADRQQMVEYCSKIREKRIETFDEPAPTNAETSTEVKTATVATPKPEDALPATGLAESTDDPEKKAA